MRGRKPKPTPLRLLTGNPGKRPINKREPMPKRGRPPCPRWLDAEARRVWQSLVPELDRLGLLTVVDGAALAAFCTSCSELRWSVETIAREGYMVRTGGEKVERKVGKRIVEEWIGGQLQPHPAIAIGNKARQQIRAFCSLFGLDPASRTRLMVPGAQAPVDEFESFLREA